MRLLLLVTIFCGFLGVAQAEARPITYKNLLDFVSLSESKPQAAAELDSSVAVSIVEMSKDMQNPANADFFRLVASDSEIAAKVLRPRNRDLKTIQVLQAFYTENQVSALDENRNVAEEERAQKKRIIEFVNDKMLELRLTGHISVVAEILSAIPTQESMLQKISATDHGSQEVRFWRGVFKELITYTHSTNTPIRKAITQALEALSAKSSFKSEKVRSQWKEYYIEVWAEMHPSNTSRIRSCLRVLSGQ